MFDRLFVTSFIAPFVGIVLWGLIIAVSSMIAMIPLFLGMLVVFPVLGHATWHLYKKAVEPA